MKITNQRNRGTALMFAVLAMLVLTLLGMEITRMTLNQYQNVYHASAWQESLMAAESGVDLAIVELRKNLATTGTSGAFQSPWVGTSGTGAWSQYGLTGLNYSGQGGTKMTMSVTVDAPASMVNTVGWQYYRIRSIGTNAISGVGRVGDQKQDLDLRKLSLRVDRYTGNTLTSPQVSRKLEVIVRPMSPFRAALVAKSQINMTDHNIVIDSYDSTDSTKSTNGQWDVTKRQQHGDIATDGTLIAAGDAQVYGTASTNNGTVTGFSKITGEIRTDFWEDIPSVNAPTWSSFIVSPSSGGNGTTLGSSTTKGATRYKLTDITLAGNDVLTITGTSTATTYVDIWVTGDISLKGNGQIQLDPNVIATFWVSGDIDLGGNGMQNGNGSTDDRPSHNLIYGIKPSSGSQSISLHGNGNMEASVYAPDASVSLSGGGSSGAFSGSVVGNTISMNGVYQVHYDESLPNSGPPSDYKIASWFEDTR